MKKRMFLVIRWVGGGVGSDWDGEEEEGFVIE